MNMQDFENGNFGIGTDNPVNLLHLSGTNTTVYHVACDVSGTNAYSPYPHNANTESSNEM